MPLTVKTSKMTKAVFVITPMGAINTEEMLAGDEAE